LLTEKNGPRRRGLPFAGARQVNIGEICIDFVFVARRSQAERYSVDSVAKSVRFLAMKGVLSPAGKLRDWRVSIIRKQLEDLGRVSASDREAAQAAADEQFKLSDEQLRRVIVQEVL
jgi:hypothetical protein